MLQQRRQWMESGQLGSSRGTIIKPGGAPELAWLPSLLSAQLPLFLLAQPLGTCHPSLTTTFPAVGARAGGHCTRGREEAA